MLGGHFQNRPVLVTGHTGFKGAWLSLWLKKLGARVTGLALPVPTDPSLRALISPGTFEREISCDIHEATPLLLSIEKAGAWLGWYPSSNFEAAIKHTIVWYHECHARKNSDMLKFTGAQIDDYAAAARAKNLSWTQAA